MQCTPGSWYMTRFRMEAKVVECTVYENIAKNAQAFMSAYVVKAVDCVKTGV